jgi:iron complex outermembrane receptor protein
VQATTYYGERWTEQFLAIPLATQAAPTHSGGVVQLDRRFGGGSLRWSHEAEPFRVSFGAEHESMKDRRRGFFNVNGVAGGLKRDEDNTVFSTDVYGQVEWRFAERWIANAGLRRSSVRFRNRDHFLSNGDDSGDRAYRATTPVAGLVFRIDPRTSVYASYGRGFETPTFVELANRIGASGLNFGLEASRSRHLEAGAKAVLGWARLSAALFDIVTENEIVVERNAGGRASFKNVGHTDRRGLELGAETVGTGPWEGRVAYTYLDATYRESFVTQPLLAPGFVTVPGGSMIPGVPRSVFYGELRYRREPFFIQLEGLNKSRVAVNDANSEFADGYFTANLVAGLVQRGAGWKLTEFVRVDNLADRRYVGSVIVNEGNGRYYEPSPRRNMTVGLQGSLEF